jgi:hypothetical protein
VVSKGVEEGCRPPTLQAGHPGVAVSGPFSRLFQGWLGRGRVGFGVPLRCFRESMATLCHTLLGVALKYDIVYGECHDQEDAEWIVIGGHNDTPFVFGRPAPARPSGHLGSDRPSGVFFMF